MLKLNIFIPVLFTDKTFNMALSVANTGRKNLGKKLNELD